MNLSTTILGILILTGMFFALRHVFNNMKNGKHDCCGGSCDGGCNCGCGVRK